MYFPHRQLEFYQNNFALLRRHRQTDDGSVKSKMFKKLNPPYRPGLRTLPSQCDNLNGVHSLGKFPAKAIPKVTPKVNWKRLVKVLRHCNSKNNNNNKKTKKEQNKTKKEQKQNKEKSNVV